MGLLSPRRQCFGVTIFHLQNYFPLIPFVSLLTFVVSIHHCQIDFSEDSSAEPCLVQRLLFTFRLMQKFSSCTVETCPYKILANSLVISTPISHPHHPTSALYLSPSGWLSVLCISFKIRVKKLIRVFLTERVI